MAISKTVRLGKKGQLVIPKEMRDALRVKEGEEILAFLEEGRVILTRAREYARKTRGLLKSTWRRSARDVANCLAKERRAWE